jgi:hypothetical protein
LPSIAWWAALLGERRCDSSQAKFDEANGSTLSLCICYHAAGSRASTTNSSHILARLVLLPVTHPKALARGGKL